MPGGKERFRRPDGQVLSRGTDQTEAGLGNAVVYRKAIEGSHQGLRIRRIVGRGLLHRGGVRWQDGQMGT